MSGAREPAQIRVLIVSKNTQGTNCFIAGTKEQRWAARACAQISSYLNKWACMHSNGI